MKFIQYIVLLSAFTLSSCVRFRSRKYCLPLKHLGARKVSFFSIFNALTWEVKFHFSAKASPVNPFYNIFYPENDISCLNFRTRYYKERGAMDTICGFAECRFIEFVTAPSGAFKIHPYADYKDCSKPWQDLHVISGDTRHLLLYSCYIQDDQKVEGAYLLTRLGLNLSETFYRRVMKPILLVANWKDFIVSDTETISYCNCTDAGTDLCNYYELRPNCETLIETEDHSHDINVYLVGVIILMAIIIVGNVAYILYQKVTRKFSKQN